MRLLAGLLVAAGLAVCAAGAAGDGVDLEGKTLQRWEFAKGPEGWLPTHSLAPFEAADGMLQMRATGPDPYAFCAAEKAFDIAGSDRQYIAIRARVSQSGSAEFFWASSPTGEETGFRAGDEIHFHMVADGAFHTYIVFPMWKGRVTRIRFDPPDLPGIEVDVDFIAIVELAEAPVPERPVWRFDEGLGGFVPRSDVSEFGVAEGVLQVAGLAGRSPALVSPAFAVPAQEARFVQFRLAARNIGSALVRFATREEPDLDYSRSFLVRLRADGTMRTYLAPTADVAGWTGEITRIEVDLIGSGGEPKAEVDTIALVPAPIGPREIVVSRFRPERAVLFAGETEGVLVSVQNAGGEPLEGLTVTLSSEAMDPGAMSDTGIGRLPPGEQREVRFDLKPKATGRQRLRLRVTADNAPAVEETIEVGVSAPFEGGEWIRHTGAYADRVGDTLWLVNEKIAAVFARNAFGYGPVSLRVLDEGGWRQVALMPDLGQLVTAQGDEVVTTRLYPEEGRIVLGDGSKAVVEFRGEVAAPGAMGTVRLTFSLLKGSDLIRLKMAFTPSRSGEILALRLPRVLAGEGAFGADLKHGLFGGLEYLVSGEHSSSTLDIAPPGNQRFAPHPSRVTMPAMAVTSPGGDLVGLLWDPMQHWDGTHTRPTALFASPNFLDDQANHLMGLFVPSVPEWVDENALTAFATLRSSEVATSLRSTSKPYGLKAGKALSLAAAVAVAREADVLRVARLWYEQFGAPEPPPMPRTWLETVALSLRGYEETAAVPGQGWRPWSSAPPGRNPRIALHYVLAERVLGRDAPVQNARSIALDRMVGHRDLDLAVHLGGLLPALHQVRTAAYAKVSSQDEKGGWYFHPDEQHRPLGQPGATTVGTVAGNVADLLAAGRLLQDKRLIEAGERGLAFMEQFTVPRGAQVWEVPLHTPDVLAAAHAVDACLESYLATGKEDYLHRAVYWAETGIPFFYTWQAPEEGLEAMKYGTIPVFGATWYTGSWFGRIVQWCGLAYAHSVWRLAAYDRSYDWKRLSRGITISGMIQQRLEPEYLGLYPDSIGMLDGSVSWGLMLAPTLILDNVFSFLGQPPEAAVETTVLGGRQVAVVSARRLSDVRAEEQSVAFRVDYPAGWSSEAAVIGVTAPTAVAVNGQPVPSADDLDRAATGFTYDETLGAVVVKISHGNGPAEVLVEGVEPMPEPAPASPT